MHTIVADRDGELRAVLQALRALRAGDASVRLPADWTGMAGEIASLVNDLAERRPAGRSALRLRRGPRADANGHAADRLDPEQGVAILNALLSVKKGDASIRLPLGWPGVAGRIADAFNDMVELNERKRLELARLSRVVGKEGKLKQRASLGDVTGFWRDSVDSINSLIEDLVHPSSEVARVIGAVAQGDLSKSMALEVEGRPLEGEFLRTARTINTMVDQLQRFAGEVTRVAREVGTEGKLGGQAAVPGVAGTWKDLTDSVNSMAGNLTAQVRNIAEVTTAVAMGDLSKKITVDVKGELLELKNTINTMVDQLRSFAAEVTRVAREVGTEGKLGGQADVQGVSGTWKDLTESVNSMAGNLTDQVRNIAEVTTAVARGDLSKKIAVDVKGEILELKNTINTMVDQLGAFAAEVTRVAREVGTDGKLGGQAAVPGVAGTWKDLTDSVNFMAGNLTAQVRNIADVTTAVANGDLGRKITVDVKGEILELKNTINTMVDQLSSFASEVTRVAREVGTDGKLGGQADVPGVAGTWKDLTELGQLDGRQPDRPGAQHRRRHQGGGRRRPVEEDHRRRQGRDPGAEGHHQHHGGPAALVRRRGDPRRPRGRHRGQARRPGRRAGRCRHLEDPHRQRQLDGRQPDRPGAQYRRGDDRRRHGRPFQEDHRRCGRRDPGAQEHHQHHGGPAQDVRRRGDACRPRGRHRGQARRPGRRAGCGRHLEGPDRERQLHGGQPDGPGAQHRRRDEGGGRRRPVQEDHRRRQGRDPGAEGHCEHHGGPAPDLCRRGDARRPRGRYRGQARRPGGGAGRRRHVEGPHRTR